MIIADQLWPHNLGNGSGVLSPWDEEQSWTIKERGDRRGGRRKTRRARVVVPLYYFLYGVRFYPSDSKSRLDGRRNKAHPQISICVYPFIYFRYSHTIYTDYYRSPLEGQNVRKNSSTLIPSRLSYISMSTIIIREIFIFTKAAVFIVPIKMCLEIIFNLFARKSDLLKNYNASNAF